MSMLLPNTTNLGCTTSRDDWDRINQQVGREGSSVAFLNCWNAQGRPMQNGRQPLFNAFRCPAPPALQFKGGLVDQLRSQLARIMNSADWCVC